MKASKVLIDYINTYGGITGEIVKVDTFLNHKVEPELLKIICEDIVEHFKDIEYDMILTAETSGLVLASFMSFITGKPFVFAKKKKPVTMGKCYTADSCSFTKKENSVLHISAEMLNKGDRLIFIDDFYAHGSTYRAVCNILKEAGAVLVGTAVAINKSDNNEIYSILNKQMLKELG